jgi:hypothetical protein
MRAQHLHLAMGLVLLVGCTSNSGPPAGTGGAGSTDPSGSNSQASDALFSDACSACTNEKCPSEAKACDEAAGCSGMLQCLSGCGTDAACVSDCGATSAEALASAQLYLVCALTTCMDACLAVETELPTTEGSAGVPGAGVDSGTGGGAESTGGSTGAPEITSTGGVEPSATGGAASVSTGGRGGTGGSVSAGTGGATPSTGGTAGGGSVGGGTNWLAIVEDWADPATTPNDALGVSGAMYAYGDDCAVLGWDPETRCVSGVLCEPGADYANWGIAVGFDFHNTGENGDPPNAKLTWDPATVGAKGVAWRLSGSAPGLQVWITNMDPSWGGVCTADDCAINGPPDGTASASLNSTLLFNNMVKDDWGGSGIVYAFDPSAILAIQFKLPAVISGGLDFSFCVEQLGIVL